MKIKNNIKSMVIGLLVIGAMKMANAQELKVTIQNIKGDAGSIRVALYNSQAGHMKSFYRSAEVKAVHGKASAVFPEVQPGTYSISVMHDANDNKKLDSNLLGIPKEGFGFSNDAMGAFGPPDFKKASFMFPGSRELVINLRYL